MIGLPRFYLKFQGDLAVATLRCAFKYTIFIVTIHSCLDARYICKKRMHIYIYVYTYIYIYLHIHHKYLHLARLYVYIYTHIYTYYIYKYRYMPKISYKLALVISIINKKTHNPLSLPGIFGRKPWLFQVGLYLESISIQQRHLFLSCRCRNISGEHRTSTSGVWWIPQPLGLVMIEDKAWVF